MKAQLRAVLKQIRIDDPNQPESVRKPRLAPTQTNMLSSNMITLATPKQLPTDPGPLCLTISINTPLLFKQKATKVLPCSLPIRKAPHKNARPFLNVRVQETPTNESFRKSEELTTILDMLLGERTLQPVVSDYPFVLSSKRDTLNQRKEFLQQLFRASNKG